MKYRKKPVVIEAFQLKENFMKIGENCKGLPDWGISAYDDGIIYFDEEGECFIKTLEGNHHASVGDYIVQGVEGELCPCKPDIFAKTYESASAEIENPKIMIVSDGDITILHLNGEHIRGEATDFLFHADVVTGERTVMCNGIIQKKDENGRAIIENDEVARQKFRYDSRESKEIQFEEVK